ncbi:hypothetical protein AAKU55_000347 [Oxalobacteraceae bacterium GrIS 1.11]
MKIIGENISDGKVFLQAARNFSVINSFPERMQNSTIEMSGGCGDASTVLDVRLNDAMAPILCFIDSDKFCPKHQGSTAIKKCKDLLDRKPGVAVFYFTKARELENILPFGYLKATIESMGVSPDRDKLLDNLIDLQNIRNNSPEIYSFIDLKLGTCFAWVAKQSADTVTHFNAANVISQCDCTRECEGRISPPFMEKFLDKVVFCMENSSPGKIRNFISTTEDRDWLDFGQTVFSMSIANNQRLT